MDSRQATAAHYEREIIIRVKERNDQLSRITPTPPSQRGATVRFRRYDPFQTCCKPFGEGEPDPGPIELKYHDYEVTREEYEKLTREGRTI